MSNLRPASSPAVAVFARAPVAGRAKTRLIPSLGAAGAAHLQRALILDTVARVARLHDRTARWLFVTGGNLPAVSGGGRWKLASQRGPHLGERLEDAFRRLLARHARAVILGTDSPQLSPRLLRVALSELRSCDAVLGPCPDGGFYLVGLSRPAPGLFGGARLGTRYAFRDVKRAILDRGFSCSVLPEVPDIDRPRDLRRLEIELRQRPALRASAPALARFLGAPALGRSRLPRVESLAPTVEARTPSKSTPRRGLPRRRRRPPPGRA